MTYDNPDFDFNQLGDILGGKPFRPEPLVYRTPFTAELIGRLQTVSRQPGYEKLYQTIAEGLEDRRITPQDAVGTLLYAITHFVEHEEPIVKAVAHTLVQNWLGALFGDVPEFETAAGRFYAHVLMGTAALQHFAHPHE